MTTDKPSAPEVALQALLHNLAHDAGDVEGECPSIKDDEDAFWAWQRYHAIEALQRRVAELEADAARYRWLHFNCQTVADEYGTAGQLYFGTYNANDLDTAIDAARGERLVPATTTEEG